MRRMSRTLMPVIVIACFAMTSVWAQTAQGTKEELRTKLREVRSKKVQIMYEYDNNTHQVNKETEDKIAKIKTQYREARDACLKEKQGKVAQLHESYENQIKPILKEEASLIAIIGPDEENNFVKTKAERKISKK